MNYKRIYDSLIERSKNRKLEFYFEKHHIIPVCMGGSDDNENLTNLTPEEHYLAHQLLVKIYPNNHSLARAAMMMIPNRPSNKMYGWLRRRFSDAQSIMQSGEGNSQYGTRWIHCISEKTSKKIGKLEPLPHNWLEGRKINFETKYAECTLCGISYIKTHKKSKWCSNKCKKEDTIPKYQNDIDTNIEYLIEEFKKNKSVDKTLREFGIQGIRTGNVYFSNILKKRNFSILRRRNTTD